MATPNGMTGARQAASGYALSALPRIKDLHHFLGHQPKERRSYGAQAAIEPAWAASVRFRFARYVRHAPYMMSSPNGSLRCCRANAFYTLFSASPAPRTSRCLSAQRLRSSDGR